MKDIAWGPVLSVEVDEIDSDHRKLIEIYNVLNQAINNRESPEYLAAVLDELINCTIWHFSHEERLMLKYDYPDADEHKAMHKELILGARELQEKIAKANLGIADEDIEYLERWLTGHILSDDMKLGAYLAQAM